MRARRREGLTGIKRRRIDRAMIRASGLGGMILGSETTHVLANSKIPVIVVR